MPSWAWHCVVEIGAVRALVRIGWPIAGTTRAELGCAAAGAAAVMAGAASDSPASPPTAATGTTARAVTRPSFGPAARRRGAFGCGAARRPSGEHSQFRSFDDGWHPDGVSTGAWPVREVTTAW